MDKKKKMTIDPCSWVADVDQDIKKSSKVEKDCGVRKSDKMMLMLLLDSGKSRTN